MKKIFVKGKCHPWGQGHKVCALGNVVSKYKVNMFTNEGEIAKVQVFKKIPSQRSRSSRGQGH